MIRVNFLTQEYKSKLFFSKFSKLSLSLILIFVAINLGANLSLDYVINRKNDKISSIRTEISQVEKDTKAKKAETNNIEDLTNKIQILEDIRNQKKYGFSEVLFQLQETIPDKVWLTSLSYSGDKLIIKGKSGENRRKKLSAEKNLLLFERNLKTAQGYAIVVPEYSRAQEIKGSKVQEFQYIITLNGSIENTQ